MKLTPHNRYDHSAIINRPTYTWPGGKTLALMLVNNIEHFHYREGLGSDSTGPAGVQNQRPYAWRDYGNRVGLWNMLGLLDELKLPAGHNCNSTVLDHCPEIAPALLARGDELIGHGRTNSERQDLLSEAEERALIIESRDVLARHNGGVAPRGWLSPWISESTATAAYGVVSGLKGLETSFDVGGAFSGEAGLNIIMNTKATMVGDGVDNNNGYSFDDEVVANNKIDKSFGLGTLDPQLHDLSINVKDTIELDINNTSLLNSEASAVTGDATARGQMAGNTGIYHADLEAGGAGIINVSVDSHLNSLAEAITGDVFAIGFGLHSVGIEASDFDFQDPQSSITIEINNDINSNALTKHGGTTSHIASSSAGMLGSSDNDFVKSVASVNALVNDHGFSQASGISGTGAIATAQQSATGISGYTFTTSDVLAMEVSNNVDSHSQSAIVEWA